MTDTNKFVIGDVVQYKQKPGHMSTRWKVESVHALYNNDSMFGGYRYYGTAEGYGAFGAYENEIELAPSNMIDSGFFATNIARANRWHDGDIGEWSVMEWAGAMAFEAGEAGNVSKKMRRLEGGRVGNKSDDGTLPELRSKLIKEVADTFTYMCILLARVECSPTEFDEAVRAKFNEVSIINDFPERV